ncbi:MAG: histidine phosphatase family protein [Anaerolineae bacterium]|jgi:probable phosphoglycerate mutase|nr:histidine phosphatase family protein [Anaerolineae bacterium]
MRVHLLRHGQTVAEMHLDSALGVPNPPLANTGIRQAEALGQRLHATELEALYSSDLLRAVETAQRIQAHVLAPLHLRPELREIFMGAIPTQGWEAFPEIHREWQKHETDVPYPGGEAGQAVQRRAGSLLTEILERHHADVALVTHGGVIMVLITACMGIGQERRFRLVAPANCSLSTLLYDPTAGLWRIERYNDTAHLSGEA